MTTEGPKYEMTLSLNVLRHLGLGLYSNVAAVLSEVVANSWDADAKQVCISIDSQDKRIIIQDDGHGMTVDDANEKYLVVGLERRKLDKEALTPRFKRKVMGRKGIGKLSLFSIARTVEVHSCKNNEKHGFKMELERIEEQIKGGRETQYPPREVASKKIDLNRGTRIILTDLKRQLQWTEKPLRKRLARRFSIIGPQHDFEITLNGKPITFEDRGYQSKLEYIWAFGPRGLECCTSANNAGPTQERSGVICDKQGNPIHKIDGWIGTAKHSGDLIDSDTRESLNKIVIMVRGKLAQEDILEEFGEGGLYTKYIVGEIHADFLDEDNQDDIATTSRQKLIEEDPRYQALKSKLGLELKHIQNKRAEWKKEQAKEQAFVLLPKIRKWFKDLNSDQKKAAEKLFGRINQLSLDDEEEKRQIFISGVLAFESLRFRNLLHRLEEVSPQNLEALRDVFFQLDDLEASAYYQIAKDRLNVINKLTGLVDENAKEEALHKHLFKHLWLLDPSWERGTHTTRMEQNITNALQEVCDSLTVVQKRARLDIYYSTTANKHVIIELKRADRVLGTSDLLGQVIKYKGTAEKILEGTSRSNWPLEIVCVLGRRLRDWDDSPRGEEESRNSLRAYNARIVTYEQLIENAQQAYKDYLEREHEAGRIYRFIQEISDQDAEAISPAASQT